MSFPQQPKVISFWLFPVSYNVHWKEERIIQTDSAGLPDSFRQPYQFIRLIEV